jgi:hypothetical protein
MGDCANVVFPSEAGNVFLYTHMRGTQLPSIVKRALAVRNYWDDPAYLARIVFQSMLGLFREGVLILPKKGPYRWSGFGIGTRITENQWPLLVLDCTVQQVRFCSVGAKPDTIGPAHWTSSFEDYIASCDEALSQAWSEALTRAKLWARREVSP